MSCAVQMRRAVLFVLQLFQNIVNAEVKDAMDWWKKQGGSVLLLTLTVPHYSDTDIKQLKKDLKKAYSKF